MRTFYDEHLSPYSDLLSVKDIQQITGFSKMIIEDGKPAVDKYINNFLCGGCSKDPIDLLKSAGVDMSTPKPVDDALNVFEDYLKKLEATV